MAVLKIFSLKLRSKLDDHSLFMALPICLGWTFWQMIQHSPFISPYSSATIQHRSNVSGWVSISDCVGWLHSRNVLGHVLQYICAPKRSLLQCLETVGRRLRSDDPIVKVANRHTCGGSYVRWMPQCFAPSCAKLSKSVMNNIEISNCVTYAKAWNVGFWFAQIICIHVFYRARPALEMVVWFLELYVEVL